MRDILCGDFLEPRVALQGGVGVGGVVYFALRAVRAILWGVVGGGGGGCGGRFVVE